MGEVSKKASLQQRKGKTVKICDYFMKKLGLMWVTTTMAAPGQYMHQWYMDADEELFGKPCKDIAMGGKGG